VNAVTGLLTTPAQARSFWERSVWPRIQPLLLAGQRLNLTIKEETRSLSQNAKFHALIGDIVRSGHHWAGKPRTAAEWKVLLISGHAMATQGPAEPVYGLEGELINLRESTTTMSRKRASSLIEYTIAFMQCNGILRQADPDDYQDVVEMQR
jgi:hypothetical protein